MTDQLSPEASRRLDQYLDAVDDVLRKQGQSREERSSVVDELAGQIYETLERIKITYKPVTLQQMADVLDRLDQPEAYARKEDQLPPVGIVSQRAMQDGSDGKTASHGWRTGWSTAGLLFLGLFVISTVLYAIIKYWLMMSQFRGIQVGSYEFWAMLFSLLKQILANPLQSEGITTVHIIISYFTHSGSRNGSNITALAMLIPLALSLPGMFAPLITTLCGVMMLYKIQQAPRLHGGWRIGVRLTLIFPLLFTHSLLTGVLRAMAALVYHSVFPAPTRDFRPMSIVFSIANVLDMLMILLSVIITTVLALICVKLLNKWRPSS